MAVLSDVDIRKTIEDNEGIIIMNMHDKNLTAVGYDFTIGFICDSDSGKMPDKVGFIYDSEEKKEYMQDDFMRLHNLHEEEIKNLDKERYKFRHRFKIENGNRYLVISEEYVALLHKYMATLHSRGSYALKGIVVTSTTIDPNYTGFIYASLINCSDKPVYIKEHNQFVTMVVHELATPTDMRLPKNEGGMPMDAEQTLNSGSSNICEQTVAEAKAYRTDAWKKIERDFVDKIATFQKKIDTEIDKRKQRAEWWSKICKLIGKIIFKKEFWIGMGIIVLLLVAFMSGGVDKVIQVIQSLR